MNLWCLTVAVYVCDMRKVVHSDAKLLLLLTLMLQKCHSDFELQGVADGDLNSKMYQAIVNRLQVTPSFILVNAQNGNGCVLYIVNCTPAVLAKRVLFQSVRVCDVSLPVCLSSAKKN